MGVLYSLYPLDEKMRRALAKVGHRGPLPEENGRNPTPSEIRRVVANLAGFRHEAGAAPAIGNIWQMSVEDAQHPDTGAWTLINMRSYPGEDAPGEVWFEKGWSTLIVTIVARLASSCGPLVLVPDTGDSPLLVTGADDPSALLATWEHTSPRDEQDDTAE